jgi:Putative phage tail protein
MATLVLTAIGSAIGGPIGGAIGAALGQRVDAAIFAPKAREGARLKELQVQTSSYGSQIPAIFGMMRVAGTVIWATDLVERRAKSSGGKGRPSTVNYSYSVSMAVALSSRPINGIGRIWADGNLLRGSAGDLKVDTQLRIYNGHSDQPVDPLMASAEQAGQSPAHRGLAYAVFEDFQLADYGNRIPSLTFEIFESDTPVLASSIFAYVSGGAVSGTSNQTLLGFAVGGTTAIESVAALLETLPIELLSQDGRLVLSDLSANADVLPPVVVATDENRERYDLPLQTRGASSQYPYAVSLRYYDVDRDFQASVQRSERGRFSSSTMQIDLPVVLRSADAKQIVGQRHGELWAGRDRWKGNIVRGCRRIASGDYITGSDGQNWHVQQVEHRLGTMEITAVVTAHTLPFPGLAVTPGRNIASPDLDIGETRLAIVELPATGTEDPGKPLIATCAAGTGVGWRSAALSLQQGTALLDIGTTAPPAILGISLDPLRPHNPLLIDDSAGLRVQLLNAAMDVPNRTGSPVDPDAPYFILGREIIRYGNCEDLGGGVYRLSRLLRNCYRTDAVPWHAEGATFVLAEESSLQQINDQSFAIGQRVDVQALGLADAAPVEASLSVEGLATIPLPPVHGKGYVDSIGSRHFSWIRRSRVDAGWRDGVDQLMVEGSEVYQITVFVNAVPVGEWTTNMSSFHLTAAQLNALGAGAGSAVAIAARQVGRHANSGPLLIEATSTS